MKKYLRNTAWFMILVLMPFASCGGSASEELEEEDTIITAPFSGKDCLFYTIEVGYFDAAGNVVGSDAFFSGDINDWTTPCLKKAIPPSYDEQYSVTYDVEGVSDEVRQIMVDKGLWDIDEEFASFTVTELIITARDE